VLLVTLGAVLGVIGLRAADSDADPASELPVISIAAAEVRLEASRKHTNTSTADEPTQGFALIEALQRELVRVGCYDAGVTGDWTPATRRAMNRLLDRANARLPTELPDAVLLEFARSQSDAVCPPPTAPIEASVTPPLGAIEHIPAATDSVLPILPTRLEATASAGDVSAAGSEGSTVRQRVARAQHGRKRRVGRRHRTAVYARARYLRPMRYARSSRPYRARGLAALIFRF
jgi:hypothetical protein